MKIVIPVWSVGPSGGFRVLCELASHWVRAGHDVHMLAHWTGQKPYFPSLATTVWLDDRGSPTIAAPETKPSPRHGLRYVYYTFNAILRGLRREALNADILLANYSLIAWAVFWTPSSARKFYYIQAYEPEFFKAPRLQQVCLKVAAFISYYLPLRQIVNAPIYLKYKHLRAQLMIPPGLDFSIMFPKQLGSVWESRPIVLGCIGRKERWKGTVDVLDAFDILLKRRRAVELKIAYGNLPQGKALPPHCTISVPKNDKELGEFYRSLDILIAPGTEQLGAVHYPVIEAMACGVPVITTDYVPVTTEANNAWIVPVAAPLAIANAVEAIIADPVTRAQRTATALRDVQQFAWERLAPAMLALFQM